MKLYILEDELAMALALKNYLVSNGYEVVVSSEGEGAEEKILEAKPDILLIDHLLPGKSGLQVLADLRERGFKAPAVFITNIDHTNFNRQDLAKLGVVAYYTKAETSLSQIAERIIKIGGQTATEADSD